MSTGKKRNSVHTVVQIQSDASGGSRLRELAASLVKRDEKPQVTIDYFSNGAFVEGHELALREDQRQRLLPEQVFMPQPLRVSEDLHKPVRAPAQQHQRYI